MYGWPWRHGDETEAPAHNLLTSSSKCDPPSLYFHCYIPKANPPFQPSDKSTFLRIGSSRPTTKHPTSKHFVDRVNKRPSPDAHTPLPTHATKQPNSPYHSSNIATKFPISFVQQSNLFADRFNRRPPPDAHMPLPIPPHKTPISVSLTIHTLGDRSGIHVACIDG